jgi:hypothetical protein
MAQGLTIFQHFPFFDLIVLLYCFLNNLNLIFFLIVILKTSYISDGTTHLSSFMP